MVAHLSIHDVTPAKESLVLESLRLCAEFHVKPALLVVPNFHGMAPLEKYPAFVEKLRTWQSEGHPIYLHGYVHKASASQREPSFAQKTKTFFKQKVVSNGEAEFASISRDEGEERLDKGISLFADLGLKIDGFIAPAWSFEPWLLPLLAGRNISYTEDHFHAYNPVQNTRTRSLVLNWASRNPERILSTTAFSHFAKYLSPHIPTRIAIHPEDLTILLLRKQIAETLSYLSSSNMLPRSRSLFESQFS